MFFRPSLLATVVVLVVVDCASKNVATCETGVSVGPYK